MDTGVFLKLFIKELEENSSMHSYYRMSDGGKRFLFRKAYIEQRLDYIKTHIPETGLNIWDAGCGYGTTSIFLALNGYYVTGTTLEYYYPAIEERLHYWRQFGKLDKLGFRYENLFDVDKNSESFDAIILQDTLHHIEPLNEALIILRNRLRPDGKIIVCEENGRNPFICLKNIRTRGFKKIIRKYDENTGKWIMFGNENARSLSEWKKLFSSGGLNIITSESEYIRLLPPCSFSESNYLKMIQKEKKAAIQLSLINDLLFWGINFTAVPR